MPRTFTINYAEVINTTIGPIDHVSRAMPVTVNYVVGYKDPASGVVTYASHASVQGVANGASVTVMAGANDSHVQTLTAVSNAVLAQEGLSASAGDIVQFPET